MVNEDLSLDLFLWTNKIHRGHLQFLKYYVEGTQYLLPKHKFRTDLQNQGYIWEDEITEKGTDLWQEILNWDGVYEPKSKAEKKKVEYTEDFLEWFNTFPKTDNLPELSLLGIRKLRDKKEECFVEYQRIIKYVEPKHLLNALKHEIRDRIELSQKKNINQLSFMKQSINYLRKKDFEMFLNRGEFVDNSGRVKMLKESF